MEARLFPETTGSDYGRGVMDTCRVAAPLASRLRDSRASLSLRWLERISARVSIDDREVFPSQDLLDHVPLLIEAIADYLEDPAEDAPTAGRVLAKAAELGQMRFEQGFGPYQILKEFELLGGITLSYLARIADDLPVECPPGEFLVCAQRVHRALALIQQATAARYLAMLEMHVSEREQRLRALHDVLSGPVETKIEEVLAAAREASAGATSLDPTRIRARLESVNATLEQLRLLSQTAPSARLQRNVPLRAAVAESMRVLRDVARDRRVEMRIPEPLPEMEVNAGPVELALLVFLTTLLRHGEAAGPARAIEIRALAESTATDAVVQVSVCDAPARLSPATIAALGQPAAENVGAAESVVDAAGWSGPGPDNDESESVRAGLDIARHAVEALGGSISLRVEEEPPSAEFVMQLPARRTEDLADGVRGPADA